MFLVTFFTLCFICHVHSQFQGSITISGFNKIISSDISDDGSIIALTIFAGKVILLKNSMNKFQIVQNITLNAYPNYINCVKSDRLIISDQTTIRIFQKDVDGNFTEIQVINTINSTVFCLQISKKENYIYAGFKNSMVRIFHKNGTYNLVQQIFDSATINTISEFDEKILTTGNNFGDVKIYIMSLGQYSLQQTISLGYAIYSLKLNEKYLIIAGTSSNILYYEYNGTQYVLFQTIVTSEFLILKTAVTKDFDTIIYGGNSKTFNVLEKVNSSYQLSYTKNTGEWLMSSQIDQSQLYYVSMSASSIFIFYKCPSGCSSCYFPNNCSACNNGYTLDGATCIKTPTYCVNNEFVVGSKICIQYCNKKCLTCTTHKDKCYECAKFYVKNKNGDCVMKEKSLVIFLNVRPFLNLLRKKGLKMIFLAVDDLWLYQYHKQEYDGIVEVVFTTISFVEEKQWEIVGLEKVLDKIKGRIGEIKKYNPTTNAKYAYQSRETNLFIDSTLDYFIFSVPLILVMVFLFNKIFYLLFNYSVSRFLRPYSFWLILLDLLVQNNVEFFTFVGFRSLTNMISFSFKFKIFNGFMILFLFILVICVVSSYSLYYHRYKKLARYFLVNMYRFPSSYALMTIAYGIRPFFKGLIHAIFFQDWVTQIWFLIGVQIIMMFTTVLFEIILDNHKSSLILILELMYFTSLVGLNVLLLLKYEYYKHNENFKEEIQIITRLVIYLMVMLLIMRYLSEIKQLVEECVCCKKKSSSVSPDVKENKEVKLVKKKSKKNIIEEIQDGIAKRIENKMMVLEGDLGKQIIQEEIPVENQQEQEKNDKANEIVEYYMQKYQNQKEEKMKKDSMKQEKSRKKQKTERKQKK